MKKAGLLAGLALAVSACAGDGTDFANPRQYGGEVCDRQPVAISEILAAPSRFEGTTVVVQGVTGSVCENRGCWMYITDHGSKVRVTFKDYSFFVPIGSEGKRVRAEGVITSKQISKETLQHWAEEEAGGDPSAIRNDSTIVMLEASGVLMENGEALSPDQLKLMENG